jgi:D-alanyl-D-alanine carboxypeptidase
VPAAGDGPADVHVRQPAHAATWALLGLVVAVLLGVTAIGFGGIQESGRASSAQGWHQVPASRVPASYAVPDPAPFAGRLRTPALLVVSRATRPDHLAEQVRRRAGVVGAEPIGLASLAVMGRTVTAAAIDPASYRLLSDADTARTEAVWDAVARGDLTITHGVAEGLRLGLGGTVVPGIDPTGPRVPVGAIATTVPGIDLVVNRPRGDELGIPGGNAVVVSLGEGAAPDAVRRDLQRVLGRDASVTDLTEDQPSAGVYAARLVGGSVADAVGSFSYRWFRDGTVAPDQAWVGANIATGDVPILGRVTCHRVMLPQLRGALQGVVDAGLASAIEPADFGGCYSPRFIGRDPRRGLSLHTWGIAVDLNVSGNQVGTPGTMDPRVVRIFESWGFAWGGRWAVPDPMHFELAAIAR